MMKMKWRRQRSTAARKGRSAGPRRWVHGGLKRSNPSPLRLISTVPALPKSCPWTYIFIVLSCPSPPSWAARDAMGELHKAGVREDATPASGGGARPSCEPLPPSLPPARGETFRNARGCGSLEPGVRVGACCCPGGSANSEGFSPSLRSSHRSGVSRVLTGRVCLWKGTEAFASFLT